MLYGWPEPYICTVYTYACMVLANPIYICIYGIYTVFLARKTHVWSYIYGVIYGPGQPHVFVW
jgi:hypothetical protein